VVRPGYAVLDERPVIQILERDDTGRPTRILTTAVSGLYDTMLHGWRAWGSLYVSLEFLVVLPE
jgi:hypothetical protein